MTEDYPLTQMGSLMRFQNCSLAYDLSTSHATHRSEEFLLQTLPHQERGSARPNLRSSS